jgi:hypothetical protein
LSRPLFDHCASQRQCDHHCASQKDTAFRATRSCLPKPSTHRASPRNALHARTRYSTHGGTRGFSYSRLQQATAGNKQATAGHWNASSGYSRLQLATAGYSRQHAGYSRPLECFIRLQQATAGYSRLQQATAPTAAPERAREAALRRAGPRRGVVGGEVAAENRGPAV